MSLSMCERVARNQLLLGPVVPALGHKLSATRIDGRSLSPWNTILRTALRRQTMACPRPQAIDWSLKRSYTPLVARVRQLNDKKKPDHWWAARASPSLWNRVPTGSFEMADGGLLFC